MSRVKKSRKSENQNKAGFFLKTEKQDWINQYYNRKKFKLCGAQRQRLCDKTWKEMPNAF